MGKSITSVFLSKKREYVPAISFLDKETLRHGRVAVIFFSFVVFTLVLWLRSWETLSVPSLFVEDASHYFNKYYGCHNSISEIFSRPHGYYNIINHFVGWITAFCDVRIQPALYVVFALLMCYLAVFLVSFSGIVSNRILLFSLPFVLGLSGLNHIFYYTTLTYQMYVVIIVLLMIILLPAPTRWISLIFQCIISIILVFSGPYSVVSIPVCLFLFVFFNDKKKLVLWGVTILAAVFYMFTSGGAAKLGNLFNSRIVEKMIHTMINDVCFLGVVDGPFMVLSLIVFFFILFFFCFLRKDRFFIYLAACLLVVCIVSTVPFFLSTKIALYRNPYPCHLLIAQFFWIIFVYYVMDRTLMKYKLNCAVSCSIVILLFCLVWYDNSVNTYKANVRTNENIKEFTKKIHYAESLNLEEKNQYVEIAAKGARQVAFEPRVRVGSYLPTATNAVIDYNTIIKD